MKIKARETALQGYIVRFADADTVIVLIKLAWGVWLEKHVRLTGIESWELDSSDYQLARDAVARLNTIFEMTPCILTPSNSSLDKYGRIRARVDSSHGDLADFIVRSGYGWYVDRKNRATLPQDAT